MADSAIVTGTSVREYFRELLGAARERQRLQVDELTEFYLVNLLSEFADPERLWVRDEEGRLQREPLALILLEALEAQRKSERAAALRRIGDTSLWVSGFVPDSVERQLVDIRYYMSMGHLAYSKLSRLLGGEPIASLFEELAAKFGAIVDLLNDVSERVALTSQLGVVRLYERFLQTGSARLARLLAEQGLIPPLAGRLREVQ